MQNARKILARAEGGLVSDVLGLAAVVTLLLGALHLPTVM